MHFEVALVLLVLTALVITAAHRHAPGLELSALRQAPALATSLGVSLAARRLAAFSATAALAGLAGALAVQLQAVADPAGYDPLLSFKLLVAVLLGGAAATLGPATGVALLGLIGLVSGPLARLLRLPMGRSTPPSPRRCWSRARARGGGDSPMAGRAAAARNNAPARAHQALDPRAAAPAAAQAILRAAGLRKASAASSQSTTSRSRWPAAR